uniref:Uncharacterized protein n=1 Tax=Arundo donax TaxID=35708 RepID=A0A0A8XN21_ARUDO
MALPTPTPGSLLPLLPASWPWVFLAFMKQKHEQQGHWNKSFIPCAVVSMILICVCNSEALWLSLPLGTHTHTQLSTRHSEMF